MAGDFREPVRSIVDGVPMIQYICGMHFCDCCGDCMHCYGSDPCYDDKTHMYVPEEADDGRA